MPTIQTAQFNPLRDFLFNTLPHQIRPRVRSRFRAKHRLLDLPAVLIQQDGVGPHAKTGSAAPQSPHAVLGKIGVVRREISW